MVGATVMAPTPPPPRLPVEGGLSFDVRDAQTGKPIPCKLTLVGVDGTPDPQFTRVDIGRQEGDGAIVAFNRIMSLAGVGVAHVPAGTYDVTVSRGPEWEITTTHRLKMTPRGASVIARLAHVVDTTTPPAGCRRIFTFTPRARPIRGCRCRIESTSSWPTTCR